MRKELYEALRAKLAEIEEIKTVDLWNRNVEFIEQEAGWARPAVFVEFRPITWSVMSGGAYYRGSGELLLHIVTDWDGAEGGLEALSLSDKILEGLRGLEGKSFGSLRLVESDTNHDHEDIVENIEVYAYKGLKG